MYIKKKSNNNKRGKIRDLHWHLVVGEIAKKKKIIIIIIKRKRKLIRNWKISCQLCPQLLPQDLAGGRFRNCVYEKNPVYSLVENHLHRCHIYIIFFLLIKFVNIFF